MTIVRKRMIDRKWRSTENGRLTEIDDWPKMTIDRKWTIDRNWQSIENDDRPKMNDWPKLTIDRKWRLTESGQLTENADPTKITIDRKWRSIKMDILGRNLKFLIKNITNLVIGQWLEGFITWFLKDLTTLDWDQCSFATQLNSNLVEVHLEKNKYWNCFENLEFLENCSKFLFFEIFAIFFEILNFCNSFENYAILRNCWIFYLSIGIICRSARNS